MRAASRCRETGPFRRRKSATRSIEEIGTLTRLSLFNSPLLLGFEQFERTVDRVSKSGQDGSPPYNIEQIGDDGLRITLAVAGFPMDDLSVQVETNQLVVRGRQTDEIGRAHDGTPVTNAHSVYRH